MAQRIQVVTELKRALKERALTYADVARKLGLSVPSIKRLFSTGKFSLQRVDALCEMLELELSDLLERAQEQATAVTKLTLAQEQEVVSEPKLFLLTWLLLTRTRIDEILKTYQFTERELQRYLLRLDRLRIIELQPLNKVRLLVSRHFSWRPGGPVQKYIHQRLLREFLSSHFQAEHEEFIFHGASVSAPVLAQVQRVLQQAARECVQIMEHDPGPPDSRAGAALVLALRRWEFSGFAQFLRP